jgi:hypothetical protein
MKNFWRFSRLVLTPKPEKQLKMATQMMDLQAKIDALQAAPSTSSAEKTMTTQSFKIIPTVLAKEIEEKSAGDYIIEEVGAEDIVDVSYDNAGNMVIEEREEADHSDYQPECSDESDHFELPSTNSKERQREERKVSTAKVVRF